MKTKIYDINYLAHMLDESSSMSDNTEYMNFFKSDDKKYIDFINNFASENGFKFHAGDFGNGDDIEFQDFMSAVKYLNSFEGQLKDKLIDDISSNPEKYGIQYNDDSDYDSEYGYGSAGNYSENEIEETAEYEANNILGEIETNAIALIKKFLTSNMKTDFISFATKGKGTTIYNDCLILGDSLKTDLAIWLEK